MKTPKFAKHLGLLAVSCFILAGCDNGSTDGTGDVGLNAAIVPGADLVIFADPISIEKSSIGQFLKNLSDSASDETSNKGMESFLNALKIAGLSKDDFSGFLGSVDFSGQDMNNLDSETLNAVLGISLKKKITADQLEAAIKLAAKDNPNMIIERSSYAGADLIIVKENKTSKESVALGLAKSGTVFLIGTHTGTTGALDRLKSGKAESLPSSVGSIKKSLAKSQIYLVLVPTDGMLADMKKEVTKMEADPSAAMKLSMMKPFTTMKSFTFTLGFSKAIDIKLAVSLASDSDAAGLATALDTMTMVLGMAKMGLAVATGGKPVPMAATLKATADGSQTAISVTITEEDITILKEAFEKNTAKSSAPPMGKTGGSGSR